MRLLSPTQGAATLAQGGTIIFPTETVYGLGANALDKGAIERLYQLKGREAQNKPFTCQLAEVSQVFEYAVRSDIAERLASFWPGPLTLVLRSRTEGTKRIPDWIAAGSPYCGFRIPDHAKALELLRATPFPVAAPSANFTGKPPPRSFDEIDPELLERVDGVIDGGVCQVGTESTVVLVDDVLNILRVGAISPEEIRKRAV